MSWRRLTGKSFLLAKRFALVKMMEMQCLLTDHLSQPQSKATSGLLKMAMTRLLFFRSPSKSSVSTIFCA